MGLIVAAAAPFTVFPSGATRLTTIASTTKIDKNFLFIPTSFFFIVGGLYPKIII
jgi:hypothetical protein